ncbi:glucosamine-6-phosphate deaminase [Dyadobacter psychrotolerans]|uniref:Glucosamine-6-phosphate deaminase n=1 Tax=Dyadobacter psychrotolerans TaxID=2541721 RepID=A0A4R5DNT0_9BACT|nr:glucosamine-6-phosphate deaminase [Dyadobacter psychrotolerans]TDE15217.1 glucosamine-6-phosphate deaminase [Dyadobacter psychrotolerans]
MSIVKKATADQLNVMIFEDRQQLGEYAAQMVAEKINELLDKQQMVNIIFAAAASQNEFLATLIKLQVDWKRINAFHMDEYIGLPKGAKQHFSYFLGEQIFNKVPFANVFCLDGSTEDTQAECERYSELLMKYPTDITCMGIGENTHLAFNDPYMADFNENRLVKVVELAVESRQQQVNEDCFEHVSQVPSYAYTLTVPALLKAKAIYSMVPGPSKAQAVFHTLNDEISVKYPSTILRTLSNAYLFLDTESAADLDAQTQASVLTFD